jgi:ATP-dependent Zn protease
MSNDPESKVFVIAATNHEDSLDKALRQSGRLGKEIRFEYPTYGDRRTFIVNILEKRTINVQSDKWSKAINQLASEAEDCTYEDIRKVIEDAFVTAKFNGASIEPGHLNQSLDKNIRGIIPVHDHEISKHERNIVAAHQAGYVLATKILAPHLSIAKVTTEPIREGIKERSLWSQWNEKSDEQKNDRVVHGKLFTYGKKTRDMLVTTQEQVNACIIALSGYAAGNVQLGAPNNSSAYLPEKRQEAFEIAKITITKGVKIDDFNEQLKNEFLKRALALRSSCEAKATMLIEQNKEALQALYAAILKHGTLSGKAIDAILAQHQLKGLELDQHVFNFIEAAPISA